MCRMRPAALQFDLFIRTKGTDMYYPYFITYIALGFAVTVPVFIWALKSGQFGDQQRARFLALEDDFLTAPAGASVRFNRLQIIALFLLALAGLAASASVLIFAIFFGS